MYMYKKLRCRSQFWSDFHEIHAVDAGPLMGEPYFFLETVGLIEPQIWGKMCPQNRFFGFKLDGMGFFEKKN